MFKGKQIITYVIPYFDDTGPMRAPFQICKGFVEAGWSVEIVTLSSPGNASSDFAWEYVPIRKVEGPTRRTKLLKLALNLLPKRNGHLVLTEVWNWHCFALMLSKMFFGSPYALTLDTYTHLSPRDRKNILSKWRLELRYGLVMRRADVILAESPLSFEYANRHIKGPEILMVPVCFWEKDLRKIEAKWTAEDYRPVRQPVIFYAGQIIERKNIHQLIEAFSRLARRFTEWTLEIRGPVTDPDYLAMLQELGKKYGLVNRIQFLPGLYGERLYRRYLSSSIYCLPSKMEGMPTTIHEAMYFGGAIVAGNSGVISYQLDGGDCGLIFEPGDMDCLTGHLETLMSSEMEREKFLKKAHKRLLEVFTWERYFDSIESTFGQLV